MPEASKSAAAADACLEAAHRMHHRLQDLILRVELEHDPSVGPAQPLPVDVFLAEMPNRKNAPQVIYRPKRLGSQQWTENLTCFVYGRIEQAFVSAGNLPGKDRAGQKANLEALKAWIDAQLLNPDRPVEPHFVQRISYLFRKGLMEDRRSHRIGTLLEIAETGPTSTTALSRLRSWVESDLKEEALLQRGRPVKYQKIMFAVEIANLWNTLTGKKIARGPNTNFARFVRACWVSGFEGRSVDSNFKRILREHIAEQDNTEACERTRYFGRLM